MDGPSRISWAGHAGWLAMAALGTTLTMALAEGRAQDVIIKLEWITFGVYALIASASFPLSRRSLGRYVAVQLAAAVLSVGIVVLLVLGGLAREL